MDWTEFSKALGGSAVTILGFLVFLNWRGDLLWKAQVEREIRAIVDAKEKLDAVRVEQIEEERNDKNEEKEATRTALKSILEALRENKTVLDSMSARIRT